LIIFEMTPDRGARHSQHAMAEQHVAQRVVRQPEVGWLRKTFSFLLNFRPLARRKVTRRRVGSSMPSFIHKQERLSGPVDLGWQI